MTGLCQCTTVRHDYHQPLQAAGSAEHTGQGGVSSTAFCQCHDVAKTTALVANPPANNIQDSGHYIQDQNYRHPAYLSHLIRDYQPERTLRSADKLLFSVPRMAISLSAKAFSISAPSVWNSLSHNCRSAELFSTFKRNLKTELFDTAYSDCKHSA